MSLGAAVIFAFTLVSAAAGTQSTYFAELEAKKQEAHMIAQEARSQGAGEEHERILAAKQMWREAQDEIDYELDMLARVVYFEAGSKTLSDRHRELVACVVINRCMDIRYPATIKENVYKKGQYACAKRLYSVTREQIPEYCYDAAYRAAYGLTKCPENVIYQSQFKQGKIYEICGNTYFCFG